MSNSMLNKHTLIMEILQAKIKAVTKAVTDYNVLMIYKGEVFHTNQPNTDIMETTAKHNTQDLYECIMEGIRAKIRLDDIPSADTDNDGWRNLLLMEYVRLVKASIIDLFPYVAPCDWVIQLKRDDSMSHEYYEDTHYIINSLFYGIYAEMKLVLEVQENGVPGEVVELK